MSADNTNNGTEGSTVIPVEVAEAFV